MEEVEELSFEGFVETQEPPQRQHPRWVRVLAAILAVLLIAGGAGGFWFWHHYLRSISVRVDDTDVTTRVNTSVATLMEEHQNFGYKPGRLLSVTDNVLDDDGGSPVQVSLNGTKVANSDLADTLLTEGDSLTLGQGGDLVEEYDIEHTAVPFGEDINIKGGSIQIVKQRGSEGDQEMWVGKISHEKSDRGVVKEPQNLEITSSSPNPEGAKVIALTFDDGPSQYSDAILDILKDKGVKATFFDIGQSATAMPQTEKRMVDEGHQVATHSNTHPDMTTLDKDAERADISAGIEAIHNASGVDTKVFRAPYGAFGVEQWKAASDLIDCNVFWDIDTLDWKRPGANAIHDSVVQGAHNGAIALMHDGGGDRTQTIEALPGIIDDLKAQGYTFVTIDELIDMA